MKKFYIILFCLLVANIIGYSQNPLIQIQKIEKTSSNKLSIKYRIIKGNPSDLYCFKLHILIKKEEQKLFSVSGDVKNVNGAIDSRYIYWDVLKDIDEFPKISDINVRLEIDEKNSKYHLINYERNNQNYNIGESKENLNNQGGLNPKNTITNNSNSDNNTISNSKSSYKKNNSDGYLSLLGFEYDYIDKSYQIDIFRIGIAGLVWTPVTLYSIKNEFDNTIIIPSFGTKIEFRTGGQIFRGLNVCVVGSANLASNASLAEDKNDKRKNETIYEKTNFFGGIELSSDFNPQKGSLCNIFLKAGLNYQNKVYSSVLRDYSYGNKIAFGPTQYFTVTFGVRLVNYSDDILHLW